MNHIDELISELASNCERRSIIAIAAYPRSGWTGELQRIDQTLSQALSLLTVGSGQPFRVMHSLGVVLLTSETDAVSLVKVASSTCHAPEVELRSLIVHFAGRRDAEWLDELLADLSVRANFGRFSQEPVARLIEDGLVDIDH